MPEANNATGGTHSTRFPFRRTMLVVETLVGVSGLAGSIQLLVGVATPPVSVLNPLGLASWTLPAGWLFLTVALLWFGRLARVAALALGADSRAGGERIAGDRVTFPNPVSRLQRLALIFGTVAIGMAVVAFLARRAGWWPRGRLTAST